MWQLHLRLPPGPVPAQALEKQQAYYKDRLRDEERVRGIYHDMKNHLLVLQAQTGGSQALHQAAQDLQVQLEAYESYQHTGNEYLDIVLRDKAKAAREKGIDFTAVTPFADGGFLAPLDISTLFGNAWTTPSRPAKSCRRASAHHPAGKTHPGHAPGHRGEPGPARIQPCQGTSKGDPFLHGFGIPNMRQAAERYGGQIQFQQAGETFRLKLLLPIP